MPTKIFKKIFSGWNGGTYINRNSVNVPPLLLNLYPGASAAYSFRKLDTTYAGSAVQVRRISDNATQDIGFVNNLLNTSALASFLGSSAGAISIWYDQSGNGKNLSNPTTTQQPLLYSGTGGVYSNNGVPYCKFDGVDDMLYSTVGFDPTSAGVISTFVVGIADMSTATTTVLLHQDAGPGQRVGQWARFTAGASQSITFNTSTAIFLSNGTSVTSGAPYVYTTLRATTSITSYVNGNNNGPVTTTGTPATNAAAPIYVGARNPGEYLKGLMSEVVLYPADRTSTRAAIEQNIRNYFSF